MHKRIVSGCLYLVSLMLGSVSVSLTIELCRNLSGADGWQEITSGIALELAKGVLVWLVVYFLQQRRYPIAVVAALAAAAPFGWSVWASQQWLTNKHGALEHRLESQSAEIQRDTVRESAAYQDWRGRIDSIDAEIQGLSASIEALNAANLPRARAMGQLREQIRARNDEREHLFDERPEISLAVASLGPKTHHSAVPSAAYWIWAVMIDAVSLACVGMTRAWVRIAPRGTPADTDTNTDTAENTQGLEADTQELIPDTDEYDPDTVEYEPDTVETVVSSRRNVISIHDAAYQIVRTKVVDNEVSVESFRTFMESLRSKGIRAGQTKMQGYYEQLKGDGTITPHGNRWRISRAIDQAHQNLGGS